MHGVEKTGPLRSRRLAGGFRSVARRRNKQCGTNQRHEHCRWCMVVMEGVVRDKPCSAAAFQVWCFAQLDELQEGGREGNRSLAWCMREASEQGGEVEALGFCVAGEAEGMTPLSLYPRRVIVSPPLQSIPFP